MTTILDGSVTIEKASESILPSSSDRRSTKEDHLKLRKVRSVDGATAPMLAEMEADPGAGSQALVVEKRTKIRRGRH